MNFGKMVTLLLFLFFLCPVSIVPFRPLVETKNWIFSVMFLSILDLRSPRWICNYVSVADEESHLRCLTLLGVTLFLGRKFHD